MEQMIRRSFSKYFTVGGTACICTCCDRAATKKIHVLHSMVTNLITNNCVFFCCWLFEKNNTAIAIAWLFFQSFLCKSFVCGQVMIQKKNDFFRNVFCLFLRRSTFYLSVIKAFDQSPVWNFIWYHLYFSVERKKTIKSVQLQVRRRSSINCICRCISNNYQFHVE